MPSGAQQKEKKTIIKEMERARKQEELLKTQRQSNLIQHQRLGGSNGSLFGAFNTLIFESEKLTQLKQGKISLPESHKNLGQELPNHKV